MKQNHIKNEEFFVSNSRLPFKHQLLIVGANAERARRGGHALAPTLGVPGRGGKCKGHQSLKINVLNDKKKNLRTIVLSKYLLPV